MRIFFVGGAPRSPTGLIRDDLFAEDGPCMQMAYQRDGIVVLCDAVGAPTTVVTFAGKGLPPFPVPQTEYHKVLAALNRKAGGCALNVVTVVDCDRRFYIDGTAAAIEREVNRLLARMDTRRTIAIGLSMGGFAAVGFARRLLACNTAIAFGAHSSIHPDVVPLEARSSELRERIRTFDIVDCLDELADGIAYRLFYGEADFRDRLHASRYASAGHPDMLIEFVAGCDHNVVDFWTRRGEIEDRLGHLIGPLQNLTPTEQAADFRPGSFADLHLLVDGVRTDALWRGLAGRFLVPAGASDVALVSNTARPCDALGSDDRRDLGVCLAGLVVVDGFVEKRVSLGDPHLDEGLHDLEDGCRRWTSGFTPLRFVAGRADAIFLRVELAGFPIC